jgi:hypothetical protein
LYAVSADEGKDHYEMANCSSCHVKNGQFDPRNEKAKNRFQLQGWVTRCSDAHGTGWKSFEEEEVVEYLNTIHYKF